MSRSFTIIKIEKVGGNIINYKDGRFTGNIPSQVAKKVFSHAYRHCNGKCNYFKISIKETTQNSLKKEYSYKVSKQNQKVEIERDGILVKYNFITKVKSMN